MIQIVVPRMPSAKRLYEYDGQGTITCYAVRKKDVWGNVVERGEELFKLVLPKEQAEIVMEDLYYGEYDGG